MKVLQIANDFCRTKVHSNMVRLLDELDVQQIVYNAVRGKEFIGKNQFEAKNVEFIYSNIVKPYHRYVYHIKLNHVFKDMQKQVDLKQIDVCHASTLFTDGGLAYKLHKKYGIPYIVAIRNTDVNGFMQKAPHTWLMGIKILLSAHKIIFISEGLHKLFIQQPLVRSILKKIEQKFVLLPNGIDDYFLDNVDRNERAGHNIVCVSNFTANKNVVRLAKSALRLQKERGFEDLKLILVGGGREPDNTLPNLIKENPSVIDFKGPIYVKSELCKVFRSSRMFAMPSIHETFGLVYVEALSQNLPVLYTKNQGIDGLFSSEVGIAVDPLSEENIYKALKQILSSNDYTNNSIDFEQFRWKNICVKYREFYKSALGLKVDDSLLTSYKIPE